MINRNKTATTTPMKKKNLFDDDDGDEEMGAQDNFAENAEFAKKYEEKKKREELAQRKIKIITNPYTFLNTFFYYSGSKIRRQGQEGFRRRR